MSGHVSPIITNSWLRSSRAQSPSYLSIHTEAPVTLFQLADLTRTRLRDLTIYVVGHPRAYIVRDGEVAPIALRD